MANFQRTNTKISLLEDYYNHFDEDHRLLTRNGNVEFITTITYINKYLNNDKSKRILDIGAGTGRYSYYYSSKGYDVTALELVPRNLEQIKKKDKSIKAHLGNALDLSIFDDNSFDVTFIFGPMYHLLKKEEKIQALKEASRVTKKEGLIFVAYIMNEYAIVTYGIKKGHLKESLNQGQIDSKFRVSPNNEDLYDYVRIEDIDELNNICGLTRCQIIAADGCANYLRVELNAMDDESYQKFIDYHLSTCERMDLIGASSHTVDILKNTK